MPNRRRIILLVILAVCLGLFLLDVHGSPEQLVADLKETWSDLRSGAQ
jgi:hypothetical protein